MGLTDLSSGTGPFKGAAATSGFGPVDEEVVPPIAGVVDRKIDPNIGDLNTGGLDIALGVRRADTGKGQDGNGKGYGRSTHLPSPFVAWLNL